LAVQNVFSALKKGATLAFDKLRQYNAARLQIVLVHLQCNHRRVADAWSAPDPQP